MLIPGEIITADRDIELNSGRPTMTILVGNTGDRPVQVGSHFHFFEVNRCLSFDRNAAFGMRLDIPSGTSVRFEPGENKTVHLTAIGGNKRVFGFNALTCSHINDDTRRLVLERAEKAGFIQKGVNYEPKNESR
ncbi:urease subunit beta [Pectinatus frisingensis]|uniref:urease subunit beta n=1 Tax=Pectinatus frisingensis TaxID=865 RepID=UPI0018C779BA|nr:urease subunit beta [Pectinatus frisingensis]